MKTSTFISETYIPRFNSTLINSSSNPPFLIPFKPISFLRSKISKQTLAKLQVHNQKRVCNFEISKAETASHENSKFLIFGAVSVGVVLFLMGFDDQKALALGPEGPLMEEFWDNVRRYALYALTVSTGAIYTIFLPILELLKSPISAILLLVILGGGIFLVSQVLSAMFGVSEFAYEYGY